MNAISFKSPSYAPEMRIAKIASNPPRTPRGSGSVPKPAHFLMLAFRDDQLCGYISSALFFISRHPELPAYTAVGGICSNRHLPPINRR